MPEGISLDGGIGSEDLRRRVQEYLGSDAFNEPSIYNVR